MRSWSQIHVQFLIPLEAGLLWNVATNDSLASYSSMLDLSTGKQSPKCLELSLYLAIGNNLGNSYAIHILPFERGVLKNRSPY